MVVGVGSFDLFSGSLVFRVGRFGGEKRGREEKVVLVLVKLVCRVGSFRGF